MDFKLRQKISISYLKTDETQFKTDVLSDPAEITVTKTSQRSTV